MKNIEAVKILLESNSNEFESVLHEINDNKHYFEMNEQANYFFWCAFFGF